MDRSTAKPDTFLAHYLSILADDDPEERRLTAATGLALTLLLVVSCLACAIAVSVLS